MPPTHSGDPSAGPSRRRLLFGLGSVVAFGTFAGCSGGDGADDPTTTTGSTTSTTASTSIEAEPTTSTETMTSTATAGADETTVSMANSAFDPVRTEVPEGTTVIWTNDDSYGHTVVSAQFHDVAEAWEYDSGTIDGGETAQYTFEEAGVYEYYCSIHGRSTMCGAVLVGGATLDAQLPCEDSGGGIY
ncbi:MAG: plastocyanin/azurin family copper-binding protein [Halobacteriaceae archaeon]